MSQRSIVIVDDDEAVRDSLSMLLAASDLTPRPFSAARDLLAWIRPETDAVIITDVRMPDMDGMQLVAALHEAHCRQPIIVITGHGDIPLAVRAMREGVADFLEKPFDGETLLSSVRRCIAVMDSQIDAMAHRQQISERLQTLSAREVQVLDELVIGKSNKVIAAALQISPRTVEVYRANVMAKMQASSLSELVRMSLAVRAT